MTPQQDGVRTLPKPDPSSSDVEIRAERAMFESASNDSSAVRSSAQSVVLVVSLASLLSQAAADRAGSPDHLLTLPVQLGVTLMMILNIMSGTSINVALVVVRQSAIPRCLARIRLTGSIQPRQDGRGPQHPSVKSRMADREAWIASLYVLRRP